MSARRKGLLANEAPPNAVRAKHPKDKAEKRRGRERTRRRKR